MRSPEGEEPLSIPSDAGTAHTATAVPGIREIIRRLNTALGPTLVSALAGSTDPAISCRWARAGGPQPRPEAQARLQLAYRAWTVVSSAEGEHVARLWFVGANPWLDEVSPVEAIKAMRPGRSSRPPRL
jgi:hypothetical protein